MIDREKVIKGLEKVAEHFKVVQNAQRENGRYISVNFKEYENTCIDAIALMKDRTKDYEAWAKEIGVDNCVNCRHASFNRNDGKSTCPIEHNFALVKDGYCHLFIRVEGR